jgi:hypothetical protein
VRIVDVIQGSEEWERIRRDVPTASCFDKIITPAKGLLSKSWKPYALQIIANQLVTVVPPLPTVWMERGIELEPYAIAAYEAVTGRKTTKVGFVWPDGHERYGCSPDGLIGDDGLIQAKCPKAEKVLEYHDDGTLPVEHKPQVMGELLVTGREWTDFVAYHPELAPFILRVERDEQYILALSEALDEFCDKLAELRGKLQGVEKFVDVSITDDYQPVNYESTGTI